MTFEECVVAIVLDHSIIRDGPVVSTRALISSPAIKKSLDRETEIVSGNSDMLFHEMKFYDEMIHLTLQSPRGWGQSHRLRYDLSSLD